MQPELDTAFLDMQERYKPIVLVALELGIQEH